MNRILLNLPPMRPEIRDLWADALDSRRYYQSAGRLRDDGGFCLLGVLCDVHSQYTGVKWRYDRFRGHIYMGAVSYPPPTVLDFSQISRRTCKILADQSDAGASFRQMAGFIRQYL